MILKSFDFQCDFDFQITTSKMILIVILNHLYLGDLILKSSTYDDFAHLCVLQLSSSVFQFFLQMSWSLQVSLIQRNREYFFPKTLYSSFAIFRTWHETTSCGHHILSPFPWLLLLLIGMSYMFSCILCSLLHIFLSFLVLVTFHRHRRCP